jgi:hypothetical protein
LRKIKPLSNEAMLLAVQIICLVALALVVAGLAVAIVVGVLR